MRPYYRPDTERYFLEEDGAEGLLSFTAIADGVDYIDACRPLGDTSVLSGVVNRFDIKQVVYGGELATELSINHYTSRDGSEIGIEGLYEFGELPFRVEVSVVLNLRTGWMSFRYRVQGADREVNDSRLGIAFILDITRSIEETV